ncbi:MAG: ElyC/SanA/YdcF family protein [Pseudomonadota bacterium]
MGISLVIISLGIVLWRRKTTARYGCALTVAGLIVLVVMSFPITAYLLMRPLELQAGPFADAGDLKRRGVKYIVVLSSSIPTPDAPPAERFGSGLPRVMEGIRLWKGVPGSLLVLSGGSVPGRHSDKEAMAELPVQLGVPKEALVIETGALDTEDEAKRFTRLVGKHPFALVTSARHVPRAVQHFKARGLLPIPCPCDFDTRLPPPLYSWFLPDAEALSLSQKAIHNYVGSLWLRLKRTVGLEVSPSGLSDIVPDRWETGCIGLPSVRVNNLSLNSTGPSSRKCYHWTAMCRVPGRLRRSFQSAWTRMEQWVPYRQCAWSTFCPTCPTIFWQELTEPAWLSAWKHGFPSLITGLWNSRHGFPHV